MSADNWTVCPDCVKRSKDLRDAFVKKYYGKLDSFVYNKILEQVNKAVEEMESYGSGEYEPDKEILDLMVEKRIEVEQYGNSYDAHQILQEGSISCSLREDYEQGVNDDGFMYFIYSCSCDCGFGKEIEYDESKHEIKDKPSEKEAK